MFCGGPEPEPPKPVPQAHTYFYKDWWVVQVRDMARACMTWRFYAGEYLQAEIELSEQELYEHLNAWETPDAYLEKKLAEKGIHIPDEVFIRIQEKRYQHVVR